MRGGDQQPEECGHPHNPGLRKDLKEIVVRVLLRVQEPDGGVPDCPARPNEELADAHAEQRLAGEKPDGRPCQLGSRVYGKPRSGVDERKWKQPGDEQCRHRGGARAR